MKNQNDTPLKRVWRSIRFLIEPPPNVIDLQQRRQTRLLSALLLIIIVSGSISGLTQLIVVPGFQSTFNVIAVGVAVLIGAYILTRTKYYLVAALIASMTPSIASYAGLVNNTSDQSAFVFMLVSVLLSGILLNRWFTFGIAVLNLLGLALLPAIQPAWADTSLAGPISFHVIIPALILIAMWHRDVVESDRQEELRARELKFRAIFDNSVDAIGVSKTGIHVLANPAYVRMFGCDSADQLMGKSILDLVAPSHRQQVMEYVQRRAAGEDVPNLYETRGLRYDGTEFDMEVHVSTYELDGETYTVPILRDITEQKRVEESVRRSEERFRDMAENIHEVFYLSDLTAPSMLYISPAYETIWGRSRQSLYEDPHSFLDAVHPEDRERVIAYLERQRRIDEAQEEYRVIRPDGTVRWVWDRAVPIRNSQGLVDRMCGVVQDVTERTLVEEDLRRSEEKYRGLVDTMTEGLGVQDRDGLITFMNRQACRMLGYELEELIGRPVSILFDEANQKILHEQMSRRKQGGRQSYEIAWLCKDGHLLDTILSPNPQFDDLGNLVQSVAVFTDITERKRTEASLRISEQRFSEAMAAVSDGLWDWNVSTGEVYYSPGYFRMLGYEPGELPNTLDTWLDLVHPEDQGQALAENEACLWNETQAIHVEFRMRARDGSWRWILRRGRAVKRDPRGRALQMIGTHMDITERKQAEVRLQKSEERYRLLFENNPNPMWVYDVESLAFLAVNDAAVDAYGYSHDEFFGMTIKDIRPEEDVSRLLENIAHVTTGIDRAGYWRHRKRDGRIIDVEITSHSLLFEGRPAELVLVNDVTERKAAEDRLRKSEALYRQAIEVAGGIPYLQSYKTGITGIHYEFIGEGIRQITGYGPEEFDLPLWDSLVEESILLGDLAQYTFEEAIRRVRTGVDSIWRCEHRVRARDGSIHWVFEAAVELYDQSGVSHGSIGMFQDITERKQAEENLRISEQRYRTLAQNLPDSALLLYDQNLRFILADGPELESTGFSRKMLEGKTLQEALPPEFVDRVEANMRRALAGVKFYDELPFEDRFYRYAFVPLRDGSEKDAMAMILATNITQIRQVEDALKDSQRRLSTALRATNVGVWEWDMRTNKTYWSDENYRLMGLEPGGVESRYENWANAVHPEDLPAAEAELNKTINSRSELNIEFRVVWPDGNIRWINDIGSLSFDGNNEPIGMYGIQMDITERKRIQQELERNQRRLAFLISGSPVIIYSARSSGDFGATFVSGNVSKRMGYLPEMFTENPGFWLEHIHPDDVPGIQAEIDRLLETGSHRYEYRFRLADGKYIWMRDEMVLMRDKSGHPSEIIGSWMDITEQKRVAEERERLITELEAKNSELERFTYTVSHDLKSPLVTIKGFLGFLNQDIASGNLERQQNDIERINNAALKMEQLLRDLLELSRIGRLVDTSEVIPFEDLAGEAMDLVHGQLEARGVTVLIQPGLPAVYGDRRRLAEVLQNLLDNAAKYMGRQANPRVEIGQRGEVNGKPVFYVRDNGIGIEPQHHERIFGLFNKLDPGTEGTGIGLALVKRVIEFHGGRIWVESEPGIGSTFFFTLPPPAEANPIMESRA